MNTKTVFVIGAGASKEVDLPTGYELKEIIARLLNMRFDFNRQISGDHLIANALRSHVRTPEGREGDINPYLHESWHIKDALPLAISIDNFIDSQRGNKKIAICGKLAIVRSILNAEKGSMLHFEKYSNNAEINFSSLEKTWYLPFFQLLTENCKVDDLEDRFKSVTLIIFNYDRCVEHFLFNALQKYYRVSEVEAANIIKNINIYHPYGSVGSLPWHDSEERMEFGAEPNANQLLSLTHKIKTFTEGTDPNASNIVSIREHICRASKLIFIGFAFHKLNMVLISPDNCEGAESIKCYATTFGISNSDTVEINKQISNLYSNHVDLHMGKLSCNEFFSEFWRGLSF